MPPTRHRRACAAALLAGACALASSAGSAIAAVPVAVAVAVVPNVTLNNGVQMPVFALGTGGFDNATAADAVEIAFAQGLRHVHSAYDYFNLQGVAKGLAQNPRAQTFVTGMTSPCIHTAAPPKRNVTDAAECEALTLREVDDVLRLLGVEQLDLLLLHGPSAPFGTTSGCSKQVCDVNAAQWRAYTRALKAGKTRAIGVSNFCKSCFECLLTDDAVLVPAVNQIQVHVGTGADPEGLLSYCAAKGIVVQAYSPLAAGGVITDPLCGVLGKQLNRSAAQVGLRWLLQNKHAKPSMSLVVKADSARYIAEDLRVHDFALSAAMMTRLDAATVPKGQQDGRPSWGCAA